MAAGSVNDRVLRRAGHGLPPCRPHAFDRLHPDSRWAQSASSAVWWQIARDNWICIHPRFTQQNASKVLASGVLRAHHLVMVDGLATFFYDPSVVPTFFGIYAMLALVGSIIGTM